MDNPSFGDDAVEHELVGVDLQTSEGPGGVDNANPRSAAQYAESVARFSVVRHFKDSSTIRRVSRTSSPLDAKEGSTSAQSGRSLRVTS